MSEDKPPGGLSYKNDGGARRKFLKEPLKGTRISISGRSPNSFSPLRGIRSYSGETYILHK